MGENLGMLWIVITILLLVGAVVVYFDTAMSLDPDVFSSMRVK